MHEFAQEGQTVHARHFDIQCDNIRFEAEDHVAPDIRIGSSPHHFQHGIAGEFLGEHLAHQDRIVYDEHACLHDDRFPMLNCSKAG